MSEKYMFKTVSEALPCIAQNLLITGDEVGSRNGRVREFLNTQIVIGDPRRREVLTTNRKASIFAQVAETMWVLSGRNDVDWLSAYLPRAKDFSDDGRIWRGGYGPRIRRWHRPSHETFGDARPLDQVAHVVDLLQRDPLSRRAVIAIYDPVVDSRPGKDIPCNDFLQFQSRNGALHLTVTVRSNDLMWGWSGINTFEWSTLQEIVASLLGITVGTLTFNIGSLHIYAPYWDKASRLGYEGGEYAITPFDPGGRLQTLADVDREVDAWFAWESLCRAGEATPGDLDRLVVDPLFKSWGAVVAHFWQGGDEWLQMLHGTALAVAVARSPRARPSEARQTSLSPVLGAGTGRPSDEAVRAFYYFVRDLHATKHASYGDSWKKRGEKTSILANIARKVDRLGVGDEYDSLADTVIDLLVYLVKYSYWIHGRDEGPENVNLRLSYILGETSDVTIRTSDLEPLFENIRGDIDRYIDEVDKYTVGDKKDFIDYMTRTVAPIARDLWLNEQVDKIHGPGAAAAIEAAYKDGSLFGEHDGDDYRGADAD